MYYELTKSQKKIARKIMDKGLDQHYRNGIIEIRRIITEWRNDQLSNKETYLRIYKKLHQIDKHLAGTYNNKGGSRWVGVLAIQLSDGVISLEDIQEFDPEVRDTIILWSGIETR